MMKKSCLLNLIILFTCSIYNTCTDTPISRLDNWVLDSGPETVKPGKYLYFQENSTGNIQKVYNNETKQMETIIKLNNGMYQKYGK